MVAYKFRGATEIAFALDIILNQRLYCANRESLNDPQEGAFDQVWTADRHSRQPILKDKGIPFGIFGVGKDDVSIMDVPPQRILSHW